MVHIYKDMDYLDFYPSILKENKTKKLTTQEKTDLLKLIDEVIDDTNVLVVNNLKMVKDILSKESIDKDKLDVALSNYKRYFNRDNDGTPEVKKGMKMQGELEDLLK